MKRIVGLILLSILLVALGGCFWVHEGDGERERGERFEHERGEHEHHEFEERR